MLKWVSIFFLLLSAGLGCLGARASVPNMILTAGWTQERRAAARRSERFPPLPAKSLSCSTMPFVRSTHSCRNTNTRTQTNMRKSSQSTHEHHWLTDVLLVCICMARLQTVKWWREKFGAFTGSSLKRGSTPKSAIGYINTYHPIRLNGEDVSSWARLQPLTPALFPLLMSLSLSVAPSYISLL